ncbi:MAG: hypothetical protein H0S85_08040 [Desulfovibrionaceae bacterium]|jgi:hypothetical protein|nr:hypothetical protein [Desulfovibrionaceae bacterium]
MEISAISGFSLNFGGLRNRSTATAAAGTQAAADESSTARQGIDLSGLSGARQSNDFGSRMDSIVNAYASTTGDNYAERTLAGMKAANAAQTMVEGNVAEAAHEKLAEQRAEDEAAIEEKLAQAAEDNVTAATETAQDQEIASASGTPQAEARTAQSAQDAPEQASQDSAKSSEKSSSTGSRLDVVV